MHLQCFFFFKNWKEKEREGEGLDLDNGRAVWMMDHAQVLPTAATYIS
jgi:hypothetical protein